MQKRIYSAVMLLMVLVAYSTATAAEIPETLRGGIQVDQDTIDIALAMQSGGWVYHMPQPKSTQARWGNTDGRTTWWVGYWTNSKTKKNSSITPRLIDYKYQGDNKGQAAWRRGGTAARPSRLEWLLSSGGGIPPR